MHVCCGQASSGGEKENQPKNMGMLSALIQLIKQEITVRERVVERGLGALLCSEVLKLHCVSVSPGGLVQTDCWSQRLKFSKSGWGPEFIFL